ncbi:MAG: lambda exonuclease family protein [Acidimicrobiia bacterium]
MSLHTYAQMDQGSEEWHDIRRGLVTASVVGKLLTPTLKVADNDTSRGLTAQLVAERITGLTDPTYANDDMMRGVMHEPIAREKYAEVNGVEVAEVGFLIRDDWGWPLGASPDGLVGDDGGLEVKCPRSKSHIRTIIRDEMPAFYMAQVQACLLVSGRQWWDFVSFCAGLPMWTTRILPDPEWHRVIVAAVAQFELNAAEMTSDYLTRAEHLPATEPVNNELGLVF